MDKDSMDTGESCTQIQVQPYDAVLDFISTWLNSNSGKIWVSLLVAVCDSVGDIFWFGQVEYDQESKLHNRGWKAGRFVCRLTIIPIR